MRMWSPSAESIAEMDEYDELIWLGVTYFVFVLPVIRYGSPTLVWQSVAVWVTGLWFAKALDYKRPR